MHKTEEALNGEKRKTKQQAVELDKVKAMLAKERRRVTKMWQEKCKLQLSNEETVDAKDMEIAQLKMHLLTIISGTNLHISEDSG